MKKKEEREKWLWLPALPKKHGLVRIWRKGRTVKMRVLEQCRRHGDELRDELATAIRFDYDEQELKVLSRRSPALLRDSIYVKGSLRDPLLEDCVVEIRLGTKKEARVYLLKAVKSLLRSGFEIDTEDEYELG